MLFLPAPSPSYAAGHIEANKAGLSRSPSPQRGLTSSTGAPANTSALADELAASMGTDYWGGAVASRSAAWGVPDELTLDGPSLPSHQGHGQQSGEEVDSRSRGISEAAAVIPALGVPLSRGDEMPPTPRDRPLSAALAAAPLGVLQHHQHVSAGSAAEGDPTLGQVLKTFVRPQFMQFTQNLASAAGQVLAVGSRPAGTAEGLALSGETPGADAALGHFVNSVGGTLKGLIADAAGPSKRKTGKLEKRLPWEEFEGQEMEEEEDEGEEAGAGGQYEAQPEVVGEHGYVPLAGGEEQGDHESGVADSTARHNPTLNALPAVLGTPGRTPDKLETGQGHGTYEGRPYVPCESGHRRAYLHVASQDRRQLSAIHVHSNLCSHSTHP